MIGITVLSRDNLIHAVTHQSFNNTQVACREAVFSGLRTTVVLSKRFR